MTTPIIFHDPTSEPSRAVHWLCLEAGIDVDIEYVWLTRNEHVSDAFLKVNPLHQVPAMKHDDFCLSEATAIMNYLTDINDLSAQFFGGDFQQKAIINKHLSWYHTNLRKVLTLDYFLPVLLLPAYLGFPKPTADEIDAKLAALATMFSQLDGMLADTQFLAGTTISAADILFASDIAALEIDPQYESIIEKYSNISRWLEALKALPSYQQSHKAWEHITPQLLALEGKSKGSPEWIAEACEQVL